MAAQEPKATLRSEVTNGFLQRLNALLLAYEAQGTGGSLAGECQEGLFNTCVEAAANGPLGRPGAEIAAILNFVARVEQIDHIEAQGEPVPALAP